MKRARITEQDVACLTHLFGLLQSLLYPELVGEGVKFDRKAVPIFLTGAGVLLDILEEKRAPFAASADPLPSAQEMLLSNKLATLSQQVDH